MSDLHLSADGRPVWEENSKRKFLSAIAIIKKMQDIDAIIVSGDISNDGSLASYIFADHVFADLNIPTYWCAGNHDGLDTLYATFKPKFCHIAGQVLINGWRLYFVNSVAIDVDNPSVNRSRGIIPIIARKELDEQLSENPEPAVIILHHPSLEIGGWLDNKILKDRETFRETLSHHENVKLVLSGHVHCFSIKKEKNIIYSTASSIGYAFDPTLPKYEIKHGNEGFSSINLDNNKIIIENILLKTEK